MTRYATQNDRRQEIKDAVMGDTNIHINLITCTGSSDGHPGKYYIKHGNYFPKIDGYKETWDESFILGDDDGYPNGFQNVTDVQNFVSEEIKRIKEKKTNSLLNNDFRDKEGVFMEKWDKVLKAWTLFQEKLNKAVEKDKIINYDAAVKMQQSLEN